jgi:nitrogen fixation NifU-like protein
MSDDLRDLYQAIILDHNKRPRNYGALSSATHRAEGYNPLCGDKIEVFLEIKDARVVAITFESASCAICTASASMMVEALEGKGLEAIDVLSAQVDGILQSDTVPDLGVSGPMAALAGVRQFPARIKCAVLPWKTYRAALRGESKIEEG